MDDELDRLFDLLAEHSLPRPTDEEIAAALDLARVVARGVVRRGAPLACYAAGLAYTAGATPAERAERLRALVAAVEDSAAESRGPDDERAGEPRG